MPNLVVRGNSACAHGPCLEGTLTPEVPTGSWRWRVPATFCPWHLCVLCFLWGWGCFPTVLSVLLLDKGLLWPSRTELMSSYIWTSKPWPSNLCLLFSMDTAAPPISLLTVVTSVMGGNLSTGGVTHPHRRELSTGQARMWPPADSVKQLSKRLLAVPTVYTWKRRQ